MSSMEKTARCPEDRQDARNAAQSPPSSSSDGSASDEQFVDSLRRLHQVVGQQQGRTAAWVLQEVTSAMLAHSSGLGRGITIKTWSRWLEMIIRDRDTTGLPAWYTVLNRLQNNAHWTVTPQTAV